MKKIVYSLIIPLVVISGLVFINNEVKNEPFKKSSPKPYSVAERNDVLKKWEATPDGIKFKRWKESPSGKKVRFAVDKIRQSIINNTNMEGVVTSLSLPVGSKLGFGLMIKIKGDDYILAFGPEKSGKNISNFTNEFEQLHTLKINDKIIIRSHNVSYAPKYSFPIVAGDYLERDNKIIYKRAPRKGGC